MLAWPKKSPLKHFGLHISQSHITLLQLNKQHISHFAHISYDETVKHSLAIALQTTLQQTQILSRKAAIAVSDQAIISKIISVAANLTETEITWYLQSECPHYFGSTADQLYFDFQVLGPNNSDPQAIDIHIIASHKTALANSISALKQANITVGIIDIASHAFIRAVIQLYNIPSTITGIIIIENGIHLTIVQDKTVLFNHHENFITAETEDYLAILQRALQWFQLHHSSITVSHLLLLGSHPASIVLREQLLKQSSMRCDIVDLLPRLNLNQTAENISLFSLLIAYGLALYDGVL